MTLFLCWENDSFSSLDRVGRECREMGESQNRADICILGQIYLNFYGVFLEVCSRFPASLELQLGSGIYVIEFKSLFLTFTRAYRGKVCTAISEKLELHVTHCHVPHCQFLLVQLRF